MNRAVAVWILMSIACAGTAQQISVLNLKNGLSNNYAECILQDDLGYIWIGTRDGLNRFSGHGVEVFREQLPSAFIYSLLQDHNGKIWIGTSHGGVTIYDPKTESFDYLPSKKQAFQLLHNKDVNRIFEDANRNVWLCTLQGLAKIPQDLDTMFWFEKPGEFPLSFTSAAQADNELLFGTNAGIYTVDVDSKEFQPKPSQTFNELSAVFIRDLTFDGKGNLIAGTDAQGLIKITSGKTMSSVTIPSSRKQVWDVFIDKKDKLWAGVINGGVYTGPVNSNTLSPPLYGNENLQEKSISAIMEDNAGNIWIATHGEGVYYFNPNRYVFKRYLDGQDGTRTAITSSFTELPNGKVLIGTDGDGVKELSKDRIYDRYSTANGLANNVVTDMKTDPLGGVWLASWQGGVAHINPSRNSVQTFRQSVHKFGLRSNDVKAISIDSFSNVWMVTHGRGVSVYNIRQKTFIDPALIIPSFKPDIGQWGSDILHARNGDVWVATHAGLFRYSKDTVSTYLAGTHGSLASSLVYCVYEDLNSNIWIGTNTSLERYVPERNSFENYTALYNIPGNIKCMLEDGKGTLWLSTINRIVALDVVSKEIRQFDESLNLQRGQFYECSCMRARSGEMYFGGTEGFNVFHPDSMADNRQRSPVIITNLLLFNKKQQPGSDSFLKQSMPYTRDLELPHDQNVITFEFLSLNFAPFSKELYSYKMEGFDNEWSPASDKRIATYTNLDPGNYIFTVRGLSINQELISETKLTLKIVPPFWRTTWFRGLASLAIVFIVVGYLLLRLYASKQKRLLLERIVEIRTREVREKNTLLEQQTNDLQHKNTALTNQEKMIRKQADELAGQRDQLQQNNVALQDLLATRDRLFSIIAHDLRNPFTSVVGTSRLLNTEFERFSEDERQKLLKGLYHSSTTAYSLLENLLAWSKSQQDELHFSPERLSFKLICAELFELFADEALKKDVKIRHQVAEDVTFTADRNMLSIILRNLLSNALKHAPIHTTVEVGYHIQEGALNIFVKDQGFGIKDGAALFTIGSEEFRKRDHNHGLGLILCKEFVEKHRGHIIAKNNPDKGACFSFTLPDAQPEVEFSVSTPSPENVSDASNARANETNNGQPFVLIAEDDDDIRWYLKTVLSTEFHVIEAINGQEAKNFAFEKVPDVVISDLNMPVIDGLELCRELKTSQQTSHIPFIMLSAERSNERKISGYDYGADDYITKPVDPAVLRARLRNVIENRKKLKAIYQQDFTLEPEAFTANTIDQEFLEKLNQKIEARLSDPELNPDALTKEMNMSRTGLYMKIKALTGESVSIYIRNLRLKESRKLLKAGKMNVSEVAYAVGFNQLSYFTTCFREAFGITPSEFIAGESIIPGKRQ